MTARRSERYPDELSCHDRLTVTKPLLAGHGPNVLPITNRGLPSVAVGCVSRRNCCAILNGPLRHRLTLMGSDVGALNGAPTSKQINAFTTVFGAQSAQAVRSRSR